jgi:hypothetical protein
MESALHTTTRVLPGNRIELSSPQLQEGQTVDVYVFPQHKTLTKRKQSLMDFIKSLPPGPRSAKTWEEVERNFQEERDSWER